MKTIFSVTWVSTVCLFACLAIFISCETEPSPENNNGNNGNGNNNDFESDELSGFLRLNDAVKITGNLPVAPDLQLKINIKDTIYVMKDLPLGARVVVRHMGLHDISGFYIAVDNSSFYYDASVIDTEARDSTDVVYINVEVPDDADVDYPLTIPIKIQPHGVNGEPLDEFDKEITIADPEPGTGCSIAVPFTATSTNFANGAWKWMHTLGLDQSDLVFHREAPGLKQVSSYQTGGCCNDDGTSTTVADDPYCFEKYSDGTLNQRWRSVDVEHYFEWKYDIVWFYDNGTFAQDNLSFQTSYRPSKSDFCKNEPAYDFDKSFFHKSGTHDFTPGAEYLTITYDVTNPPVYGKTIRSGKLLYDCNGMALIYEVEGQTWIVEFRKANPDDFNISNGTLVAMNDWD